MALLLTSAMVSLAACVDAIPVKGVPVGVDGAYLASCVADQVN